MKFKIFFLFSGNLVVVPDHIFAPQELGSAPGNCEVKSRTESQPKAVFWRFWPFVLTGQDASCLFRCC